MSIANLRLGFAGSPAVACVALKALLEAGRHPVELVLTQPDRPRGRGRRVGSVPVKMLAETHSLNLYQPEDAGAIERIEAMRNLDLLVVVAYGCLLSSECLALPRLGCINLHFSLLPRWRGAAPVQHAILEGDRETGVSVFRIDTGIDTGPVLRQASVAIAPKEDAASLLERLSHVGTKCLLETIDELASGRMRQREQDHALATYAPRIKRDDACIDWHRPAAELERQVRAYNPTPGAYAVLENTELRVWEAQALSTPGTLTTTPGKPLAAGPDGLDICAGGRTVLRLLNVQPAGGRTMSAAAFARGQPRFRQLWT